MSNGQDERKTPEEAAQALHDRRAENDPDADLMEQGARRSDVGNALGERADAERNPPPEGPGA
ncbi:MAG TPA: hypothetical protein VEH84_19000 [Alphaproteobacteria bacterium]|nr:hypothetical protein [Alphaproteobacteria bacterium]